MFSSSHPYRTHTCGMLSQAHTDQNVRLSGWCHRIRDHGGLIFIDLRDHYGITQCVVDQDSPMFARASALTSESVVTIEGLVRLRPDGTELVALSTGMIEVRVETLTVINRVETLPFPVFGSQTYSEELRYAYRYLDLRRERTHAMLSKRAKMISYLRKKMESLGFTEFQTPILTASSPEGARDFLVPSRLHPGKCYALPQAPQQFKQLLMVAGFDRYFQIAPCFRDEDARADRSPGEFYQLDIEMSFVTQEDVLKTVEPVILDLFSTFGEHKTVDFNVPRIPYSEALLTYGSDKPDLRNPLKIVELTQVFQTIEHQCKRFHKCIDMGGVIRGIVVSGCANQARSFFDSLVDYAKELGAEGLAYLIYESAEEPIKVKGPLAKFFNDSFQKVLIERASLKSGDVLFLSADLKDRVEKILGKLRDALGQRLNLTDQSCYKFCWVTDFPLYERDGNTKRIDFSHNPFSMPNLPLEEFMQLSPEDDRLLSLTAFQYDLVCNGIELSSGAIRTHRADVMLQAFRLAGYSEDLLLSKFKGLYTALQLGAPPHGGIAPGIDRMVMLLCEEETIREVALFPLTQQGEDLMMGAPSEISREQLKELGLQPLKP